MSRHRFFYLLSHARHRVHKHTDRICQQELGISVAQLGLLFVVTSQPGQQERTLASSLGYNESAITALLRRMEEAGLVERRPDPDDSRVKRIFATTHGEALAKKARPLLDEFNAKLDEGFTPEELDVAARFLAAAIERFGDEEGP